MSSNQKLLLSIKNPSAITNVEGNFLNKAEFLLDIIIGNIKSVKIFSDSVLLITFDTGEIRLDIDKKFLTELAKVLKNEL